MENLSRLNSHIDNLIAALRNTQEENAQLRNELAESRAAGVEKDGRIQALENSGAEKDQQIRTQEEAMARKDAQLEELIARIEQVLNSLPQPPAVESVN